MKWNKRTIIIIFVIVIVVYFFGKIMGPIEQVRVGAKLYYNI
jgi:hypothetical protein